MLDLSWLPPKIDPKVRLAIANARDDVGEREKPMGSNRGKRIDEYCRGIGIPLGSFWCAAALCSWWEEAGLEIPPRAHDWWRRHNRDPMRYGPGSVRGWAVWGLITARWSSVAMPGAAVVYGPPGAMPEQANHIGLVIEHDSAERVSLSIEGNASLDGYSRNGELVTLKLVRTGRVIGYVHPYPLPGTAL